MSGYSGSKNLNTKQKAAITAEILAAAKEDTAEAIQSAVDDAKQKINDELAGLDVTAVEERVTTAEARIDGLADIVSGAHAADSWETISKITRSGNAKAAFAIGEQFETTWKDTNSNTEYTVAQNICHISDSEIFSDDNGETTETGNGMFLQWHYATPFDMPFDAREALYVAPAGGLPAGTYYFQVTGLSSNWDSYANNNDKTFMFTLTNDLTEGQMLILSATYNTATWDGTYVRVYDGSYAINMNTSYGTDGNMTLTEWDGTSGSPLTGNTDGYTTGANGLNHIQRALLGYNRWSQSALRQWLNSAAPCRIEGDEENYPGWWTPQNEFDRIPSQAITYISTDGVTNTGKPGFLSGYDADFIAAMRTVRVETATNTVTDGGATEYTWDKVFLPSLTQMNIQRQATEGYVWDYYKQLFAENPVDGRTNWAQGGTYPILKGYDINAKTTAVYVRLRSAYRGSANIVWYVTTSGYVNYDNAFTTYRARPACVIG
ncbi:MAG: DUF6273 domain-containing protein [Candidatus Ornithomonoglobus sp.]